MHSLSEPSQVQKAHETSASFLSSSPLASPLQSYGVAGVGQVEVRELALCIHSQDEVLLNCDLSLGSDPHTVLWLWQPVVSGTG